MSVSGLMEWNCVHELQHVDHGADRLDRSDVGLSLSEHAIVAVAQPGSREDDQVCLDVGRYLRVRRFCGEPLRWVKRPSPRIEFNIIYIIIIE